jgi:uncharacterized protein YndB with AHSA1/START domain
VTLQVAVVERVLSAPCDVVYDEWLSVESLVEWMCPRPARLQGVDIDPVVGGPYRFDIVEDGRQMVVVGTYLTLDRPHTIRFTWSCSTWTVSSHESIVTIEFRPVGEEQTHMTIRHELLPPGTIVSHQEGWEHIASQLADNLRERSSTG